MKNGGDLWWSGRYFLEICEVNDFLHRRINKRDYLQILRDQVHPMAQALFPEENAIFQDDNALIYTTIIVKKWHEEYCNEVEHLLWPVQSLELNIIEHLWSVLEIQVIHRFPLPSSIKELKDGLKFLWKQFTCCMNQYLGDLMLWLPQESEKYHIKLYFRYF